MSSVLPSAPGTASPGSHPAACRAAGSPRQVARIIREASGGLPGAARCGGADALVRTGPFRRAVISTPPLLRTLYENRVEEGAAHTGHRVRGETRRDEEHEERDT
ncbi:hypothetical protein GCM10009863_17870 [Streptomyces axinellae]|uniref:Uncharacterized protein n=1 Tax=Streptomyces axinellae TaxID=552788 RepID=A0ABP6CAB0_9ACTN